ncbi:MAG TPA: DUF4097 family beta strand repeat-containing protein [Gemmatimonadaceae bacterium]|nr:DUF4097 family beta strand repeat-containing protein [Gemmatimonadaceae bacterium]
MARIRSLILPALALLALAAAPASSQSGSARERERERERARRERERDRDDDTDDRDAESRVDTTVALDRRGVVDLSLVAGEINVTGWDRSEVRVRAYSERGVLHLEASTMRVALSARSSRGRMGDTRYEVTVPTGVRVLMRGTSADLSARGVRGEVEASSTSGDIVVSDATERVTLETVSGDIQGSRLGGEVRAKSVSGDLDLDGVNGDIDAETVSGTISIPEAQTKILRAETVSGEISYNGTIAPDGRYTFRSHSGSLRLAMPAGAGARLSLGTFSGSIESEFPITLEPGERHGTPRRFEFTVEKGGASVSLETFSGDITLERARTRSAKTDK